MMKLAGGCWRVSLAAACPSSASSAAVSKRFCAVGFFPILAAFALFIPLHRSCPFKDSQTRLFHAALTVAVAKLFDVLSYVIIFSSSGAIKPERTTRFEQDFGARLEKSAFLTTPAGLAF
ncbi:MAG: hypothetical protein ACYTEK_23770 [Planctomycetota bacterium]|jgi:hypothetical protein